MNKQFTVIVVITFLVGMLWLTFDIIFNTKPSIPLSPKLQTLLEPVNPNFNSRILEIIDRETIDTGKVTVSLPLPVVAESPEPGAGVLPDQINESSSSSGLNL